MIQYTLRDFQPVESPGVWECPTCDDFASESYGGVARHHIYCSNAENHFLHDYFGERLAILYRCGVSRNELARRLGVDRKTMSDALRSLGVTLRDTSEAMDVWYEKIDEKTREAAKYDGQDEAAAVLERWREQNQEQHKNNAMENLPEVTYGQDHHSWRGGDSIRSALISLYGDQSWTKTRKEVRADQDVCALCGDGPGSNSLDVHHIVPVLCGGDNGDYNLLGLCRSCHSKVENYTKSIPEINPVFTE